MIISGERIHHNNDLHGQPDIDELKRPRSRGRVSEIFSLLFLWQNLSPQTSPSRLPETPTPCLIFDVTAYGSVKGIRRRLATW